MAGRFPAAADLETFWRNLRDGVESISRFSDEELAAAGVDPALLANPHLVRALGAIAGEELFDAELFGFAPRQAEMLDPQFRLLLECAWEALESAGCDPRRSRGSIGVYAGASLSSYFLNNLATRPDLLAEVGGYQVALGSAPDYLTAQLSYRLGLDGPSIDVQTACSTSLVAVHLACQALLTGDCDLALAGGSSVKVPQRSAYLHEEGGLDSPRGYCRAFDAEADGTVHGSGAGIVVLKRLADAIADGDTVRAVILASAVNNDGSLKVGMTAPSLAAQARVVSAALRRAGVPPDSIGYVETHGTGTTLGDPIEVAALTQAFRAGTERSGFCPIGSVKTNIGHLGAAAGVAGLIKTVLALEHRQLPPSLHFETPNPRIDFAASPFYVNDRLAPWRAGDGPLRAGVSSFGLAGTNDHLVVEAAPPAAASGPARGWQLLPLSAASDAALAAAARRLAAWLDKSPEAPLADVAWTLQTGRRVLDRRLAVVCRDGEEARWALTGEEPRRRLASRVPPARRPVIWLFPGQGSQHPDMGRGLYDTEPVFRHEIDACAEWLRRPLGRDLRELLYPAAERHDAAARELRETRFAQPSLFVVELALARLWLAWGVTPRAMLGHSVGEYVAACLADVMSREDALDLVAARGELIQGLPAGAMVSVDLPEAELAPLLGPGLSLAAVNAPSLAVAAGPEEAVAALESRLAARQAVCRRLHTSHAFHSAMLDPILGAFAERVARVPLRAPAMPYLSSLTGDWIEAEQATDPAYWVRHLRETVRFGDAVGRMLAGAGEEGAVFVEIGPGRALSELVRQQAPGHAAGGDGSGGSRSEVVSTMRRPRDADDDAEVLLRAAGRLWLSGIDLDWGAVHAGERRHLVPLPTYPFQRRRFWVDPAPAPAAARAVAAAAATGPVDAASIPAMAATASRATAEIVAAPWNAAAGLLPRDETAARIAAIFESLLGIEGVGPRDDFFELGGQSLLGTRLLSRLRDEFDVQLSIRTLFDAPTPADLARHIQAARRAGATAGGDGASGTAAPATAEAPAAASAPAVAATEVAAAPRPASTTLAGAAAPAAAVAAIMGAAAPARATASAPASPLPSAIVPLPRGGDVPLSFAQQRLWLLDRLAPGNPFYNLGGAARLRGELAVEALAAAVAEVVRRHETLRAGFGELDGRPVQRIAPARREAGWNLPRVDLSGLPSTARQPEVERLAVAHRQRPFDLRRPPLLRLALVRCAAGDHVLLFSLHHIVADGWSLAVLVAEVRALYGAFRRGAPSPLPELPVQYGDYAAWQREWLRGEVLERELAWWRERLAGLPLVELPGDRPRPPVQSFRGGRVYSALGREASRAVAALARWHEVSLYMLLLAAFDTLVWRYGAPPDVVVGAPIANRARREVEGLIGLFVNTLVLRTDLGGDPPFSVLLDRVRETALGAYAHQAVPFEQLVEDLHPRRDLSRNPLFQLMFNLINTPQPSRQSAAELAFEPLATPGNTALFDLQVSLAEGDDGVELQWEYASDLFDRETIERLAAHFGTLLAAAVSSPEERIGGLPLLGAEERRQLLVEWNATGRPVPAAAVHELIAAQAARQPEAVALAWGAGPAAELSYGELMRRAAGVSAALRWMGAGPETLVAVLLERTPALPVSLLGVLGAGAAYVPVDPEYPAERQRLMLEDSGAAVVLTQASLAAALTAGPARVLLVEPSGTLAEPLAPAATQAPPAVAAESLAYVIYTSGSTGRPKGVAIPHGALTNFLLAMRERPGLTAGDVLLAVTSPSFDIAGLELYLPLLVGGRIELASREEAADGGLLLARLRQSGATAMQATPATWRMLLAAGWGAGDEGRRLKVLCGGEALSPGLAAELTARAGSVWNVYGPTETTVWSTLAEMRPGAAVTIGGPIANTEVYVLDGSGEPAPVGVPGELYLGGAGVARGYLGRPELTAERFVPSAFAGGPGTVDSHGSAGSAGSAGTAGQRLYRTGDLARWRRDGALECLGRVDHQVKVRGFRVELGEIEAALSRHPAVAAAAVAAREDRLLAYVVVRPGAPGAGSRPAALPPELSRQLRDFAAESLPAYMVPSVFVGMAALPLTPNGKVDRRALPDVAAGAEAEDGRTAGTTPRTLIEQLLAGIWSELLGVERIGVEDSFFELGGHSLLATQAMSRVREAFGVELPLASFFAAPALGDFARAIEAAKARLAEGEGVPPPPPLARTVRTGEPGEVPLSFAQQRLWLLDRLAPGNPFYNLGGAVRLRGELSAGALAAAVAAVVRRHETLRAGFGEQSGRPVQRISPLGAAAVRSLPLIDLGGLPATGIRRRRRLTEEVERLAAAQLRRPFDLSRPPLLRLALVRLSPRPRPRRGRRQAAGEHVLRFALHHIVADGWSLGVLVGEVAALYGAFRSGEASPLPELPVHYGDYAAWQREWLRGVVLARELAWRRELKAALPLVELPGDRPRPPVQSFRGGRVNSALDREASQAATALARRQGVSLYMLLLAAFDTLVWRYGAPVDVVVGTPIANRTRREVEGLIGLFANTLVLRTDLGGDPAFGALLRRVRETALGAYAHQDVPFEQLVEELHPRRDLSRNPLFQLMFNLINTPQPSRQSTAELTLEPVAVPGSTALFDLQVYVAEAAAGGEGIVLSWEYASDLFDRVTIERLAAHFGTLLAAAVSSPEERIGGLPLLGAEERRQLLVEWNATGRPVPAAAVHELIAAQAARQPEAVALAWGAGPAAELSYGELMRRAAGVSAALRWMGAGPETLVAVLLERTPALPVSLLGVLGAGAAYVPVDPEYPAERQRLMLEDSGATVVLTQAALAAALPAGPARVLLVESSGALAEPLGAGGDDRAGGDRRDGRDGGDGRDGAAPATAQAPPAVAAENLAYVIYTSGSTGRPKGVAIPHGALTNFLLAMRERPGLTAGDALLAVTSPSFDIAGLELYLPLLVGGRIELASREEAADGGLLLARLRQSGATAMQATPATWRMLLEAGWGRRRRGPPAQGPVRRRGAVPGPGGGAHGAGGLGVERLRSHRDDRVVDARRAAAGSGGDDRRPDREHRGLRPGRQRRAGAGGRARRAVPRRRGRGARLPGTAGADGGAVRAERVRGQARHRGISWLPRLRPLRRATPVPDRGPGALAARRRARVPGTRRPPGQGARLPRGAGRDRGGAVAPPGGGGGGGGGAGRPAPRLRGRAAAGARRGRRGRGADAGPLAPAAGLRRREPAGLHGAVGVRRHGGAAADPQRQGRPPGAARRRRRRRRGGWADGGDAAAHTRRTAARRHLERVARPRAHRRRGRLLRAGRPFAAGDAAAGPGARVPGRGVAAAAPLRGAHPGGAGGHRRGGAGGRRGSQGRSENSRGRGARRAGGAPRPGERDAAALVRAATALVPRSCRSGKRRLQPGVRAALDRPARDSGAGGGDGRDRAPPRGAAHDLPRGRQGARAGDPRGTDAGAAGGRSRRPAGRAPRVAGQAAGGCGGRPCLRPGGGTAAAAAAAAARRRGARGAADHSPHRRRRLVAGHPHPRADGAVPRGDAPRTLAAGRAADPVRRLRRLAARPSARRGPGGRARLLAVTPGGSSGAARAAGRPAAAGDPELPWRPPRGTAGRSVAAPARGARAAGANDAVHGPSGRVRGAASASQRTARRGRGLPCRRPAAPGDRGPDRSVHQHSGAARRCLRRAADPVVAAPGAGGLPGRLCAPGPAVRAPGRGSRPAARPVARAGVPGAADAAEPAARQAGAARSEPRAGRSRRADREAGPGRQPDRGGRDAGGLLDVQHRPLRPGDDAPPVRAFRGVAARRRGGARSPALRVGWVERAGAAPAGRRVERHRRRVPPRALPARADRRAGSAHPGGGGGALRRRAADLWRARRAVGGAGVAADRDGRRRRVARGSRRRALGGDDGGRAGDPPGRRRLRAARPGVSARPPVVHGGGRHGREERRRRAGARGCAAGAQLEAAGGPSPGKWRAGGVPRRDHRCPAARRRPGSRRRASRAPRAPRQPGLRDLHLGLDRQAQGRDEQSRRAAQSSAVDAVGLRPHRRRPGAAEDPDQLRRLGLGAVLAAARRRHPGGGATGRPPGPRLPGAADPRAADHHPALRALDAAGLPRGSRGVRSRLAAARVRQRRGAAGRARAALPRAAGVGGAVQPLRSDRGGGGRHRLALRARLAAPGRADRPAGGEHQHPPARPGLRPGADRRGGRALHRRGAAGARLPEPSGADRGAVRAGPRGGAGGRARRAPVPDRRPGPPPGRRHHRVPGPRRSPGEGPRLPHRAGRDRSGARRPSGGPRSGGAGASRACRRHAGRRAPGGLRGALGLAAAVARGPASPPGPEPAGAHAAVGAGAARRHAHDAERQGRPAVAGGAGGRGGAGAPGIHRRPGRRTARGRRGRPWRRGRGGGRHARARGAAHAAREPPGGPVRGGAGQRAGRRPRQLLRPRRQLDHRRGADQSVAAGARRDRARGGDLRRADGGRALRLPATRTSGGRGAAVRGHRRARGHPRGSGPGSAAADRGRRVDGPGPATAAPDRRGDGPGPATRACDRRGRGSGSVAAACGRRGGGSRVVGACHRRRRGGPGRRRQAGRAAAAVAPARAPPARGGGEEPAGDLHSVAAALGHHPAAGDAGRPSRLVRPAGARAAVVRHHGRAAGGVLGARQLLAGGRAARGHGGARRGCRRRRRDRRGGGAAGLGHGGSLRPDAVLAGRAPAGRQDAVVRARSGGAGAGRGGLRRAVLHPPGPSSLRHDPLLRGGEARPAVLPLPASLRPPRAGRAHLDGEPPEHPGAARRAAGAAPSPRALRRAGGGAREGAARPVRRPGHRLPRRHGAALQGARAAHDRRHPPGIADARGRQVPPPQGRRRGHRLALAAGLPRGLPGRTDLGDGGTPRTAGAAAE